MPKLVIESIKIFSNPLGTVPPNPNNNRAFGSFNEKSNLHCDKLLPMPLNSTE